MPLHLRIENESSLPDGGPISCTVNSRRGIDIGRDQYLDWVLPDPTRFISGRHCEIRFRDGQYWLQDVSTNGTFVNRSEFRINGAHALRNGDKIEIGKYIIDVVVEPEAGETPNMSSGSYSAPNPAEMWSVGNDAAPAINPRELRPPAVTAGLNTFDALDWASDIPTNIAEPVPLAPVPGMSANEDWLTPAPPVQTPRPSRPVQVEQPAEPQAFAPQPVAAPPQPEQTPFVPPGPQTPKTSWELATPVAAPPMPVAAPFPLEPPAPESHRAPVIEAPAPYIAPPPPVPAPPVQAAPVQTAPPPAQPAPVPPAAPVAAPFPVMPAVARAGATGDFKRRFAQGAGLPPETVLQGDDGDFAELAGRMMRLVADNLRQLHIARAQAKGAMRSANQTLVGAIDNNPLRFLPTSEDALRVMLGPKTKSYLDGCSTLESSFLDLKKHQLQTFSAMQTALSQLLDDLEPAKIDASEKDKGGILSNRKAKLWERYLTTWQAKVGKHEQGMLGIFMQLFAQAYDKN